MASGTNVFGSTGSSSGGGTNVFGSGSSSSSSHHRSAGGVFTNLLKDVRDAAVGIPTGVVQMVKHPVDSVENVAEQTWHTWSPLFHGDVKGFASQTYDHPLAPLLDIATLVTGGAGAAGKLAKGLDAAGIVDESGKIARLAKYSDGSGRIKYQVGHKPSFDKALSKNPLIRKRQEASVSLLNRLEASGNLPQVFSYEARYTRRANRDLAGRHAALMTQIANYVRAGEDLSGPQRHKFMRRVLLHSYRTFKQFSFAHDAAAALPEGHRYVLAEPAKVAPAALKVAKADVKMYRGKMRGIANTLDTKHGVKLANPGEAAKALKKAQADLKLAQKQLLPHTAHQTRVKMLERYIDNNKALKAAERRADSLANRTGKAHENFFAPGHEDFAKVMHGFANRYTTTDVAKAAKTADGKVMIVPVHELKRLGKEGANSIKALDYIYRKPTALWKATILGYRPAFFVNNFVGNHMMYLMSQGGAHAFRGYVDALRQVHSERAVQKSLGKVEAVFNRSKSWQLENYKDQLTNTLADSTISRTVGKGLSNQKIGGKWRQGLFGVTHNYADIILRRATINNTVRDLPEVRKLMKKGLSFDDAARAVHKADKSGDIRRMVSGRVMDVMGDYHSLNKLERGIKEFVPFYTWDRHITRHMMHMLQEKPLTTAAMAKVGQQGTQATEQILGGEIPDFLKGAIPMTLLGLHVDHPSRKAIMTTAGLNPYATIPDLAEAAKGIVTGGSDNADAIGSQLNPLAVDVLQRMTGRKLLTGAPNHPSMSLAIPGVYTDQIGELPQWKLIKSAIEGTPETKVNKHTGKAEPAMYEKNFGQFLSQFLGAPIKQLDTDRAAAMKKRDENSTRSLF